MCLGPSARARNSSVPSAIYPLSISPHPFSTAHCPVDRVDRVNRIFLIPFMTFGFFPPLLLLKITSDINALTIWSTSDRGIGFTSSPLLGMAYITPCRTTAMQQGTGCCKEIFCYSDNPLIVTVFVSPMLAKCVTRSKYLLTMTHFPCPEGVTVTEDVCISST